MNIELEEVHQEIITEMTTLFECKESEAVRSLITIAALQLASEGCHSYEFPFKLFFRQSLHAYISTPKFKTLSRIVKSIFLTKPST